MSEPSFSHAVPTGVTFLRAECSSETGSPVKYVGMWLESARGLPGVGEGVASARAMHARR